MSKNRTIYWIIFRLKGQKWDVEIGHHKWYIKFRYKGLKRNKLLVAISDIQEAYIDVTVSGIASAFRLGLEAGTDLCEMMAENSRTMICKN